MLSSSLLLDLRYRKTADCGVPFRYCHPLKDEALAILSFTLPMKDSPFKSELVSRVLSRIAIEKGNLSAQSDSPLGRLQLVEALWFFGSMLDCDDDRLKYEVVNNGCR